MARPQVDRRIILSSFVLFLGNLAVCTHRSSRVYLFQQTICLNHYRAQKPEEFGGQTTIDESLCKNPEVQAPLSIFEGVDAFLQLLPALIVLAAFQKLLPAFGLRYVLFLNVICATLSVFFSIFSFSFHSTWSNYAILSTFIFDLIGGGDFVRMTACITCVAAICPPENLAKSYNYITSLFFIGSLLASVIGSYLLSNHVYLLNACSILFCAVTLGVILLLPGDLGLDEKSLAAIHDPIAAVHAHTDREDSDSDSLLGFDPPLQSKRKVASLLPTSVRENADKPTKITITSTLLNSWHSSFHSITTIFQIPNPTFTVILIFFVSGIAMRSEILFAQYISLTLHWSLATVNSALAVKALVSAIAMFCLPSIRTRFLEPRLTAPQIDLFITQYSLLAEFIGIIGLGFALPAPLFIIALCIYTCGIGFYDSLSAYGTYTLPAGHTASDLYVRTGLIQTIAGMIGAPIWSGLFSFVVKSSWLPDGLPFWIAAVLLVVGIAGVRVLKRWASYTAIGVDGR